MRHVDETWWYQLLTEQGDQLCMNNSWSGSTISYTGGDKADCSKTSSFIFRLEQLAQNGFFSENQIDTVYVFGGTNDNGFQTPLGNLNCTEFSHDTLFQVFPAISYFMKRLKEILPKAKLVWIINTDMKPELADGMEKLSRQYGFLSVRLNPFEKISYHPSVRGMREIKDQIIQSLKNDLKRMY